MTRLIFVRHGQTIYNLKSVFCGQLDVPLTELGLEQAEKLKAHVLGSGLSIDAIWSSDLSRAIATLTPTANALSLPITPCKGLREIDAGDFVNKTYDEVKLEYPDVMKKLAVYSPDTQYPNGENLGEAQKRIYSCVCEIAEQNDGKTVLIASHAGAINALIREAFKRLGKPIPPLHTSNCSLSFFEVERGVITPTELGVEISDRALFPDTQAKKKNNNKDITVI